MIIMMILVTAILIVILTIMIINTKTTKVIVMLFLDTPKCQQRREYTHEVLILLIQTSAKGLRST